MHAVGRVHDLLRHFVFGHVQSKTISREAAKIAKKTLRDHARAGPPGRSALGESIGVLSFCSIVSVESRNPKCERRTPCNILRTNIGTRLMER